MGFFETLSVFAMLVVFAYVVVRVSAYAWYKTKLEHFRSVKKEAEGDMKDGV